MQMFFLIHKMYNIIIFYNYILIIKNVNQAWTAVLYYFWKAARFSYKIVFVTMCFIFILYNDVIYYYNL